MMEIHRHFRKLLLIVMIMAVCPAATAQEDLSGLYQKIDGLLAAYPQMVSSRCRKINEMKDALRTGRLQPNEEYIVNSRLYNEYSSLKFDSAFKYVERNIMLMNRIGNVQLHNETLMQKVHILTAAGLFEEASQSLKEINVARLGGEDAIIFYTLCEDLYLNMAQYTDGTPLYQKYQDLVDYYRKKIYDSAPHDSWDFVISRIRYLNNRGERNEAVELAKKELRKAKPGTRIYSRTAATLAYFYELSHNEEMQKRYLALSVISDLTGIIRETSSMRKLSVILYKDGDIDRAYRYLMASINDATFYHAKLRNAQSTVLIPTIAQAYHEKRLKIEKGIKVGAVVLIIFLSVLFYEILYTMILIRREHRINRNNEVLNNNLKDAITKLNVVGAEIQSVNRGLYVSKEIKERQIIRFIRLCTTFVIDSRNYKNELNQIARKNNVESLDNELSKRNKVKAMINEFYKNFDIAFLEIYPDFVKDINKLMKAEKQFATEQGGRLNANLRMLALLRLGISRDKDIAEIMHSSVSTVYSYRSRLKAHAIKPEDFEVDILKLG